MANSVTHLGLSAPLTGLGSLSSDLLGLLTPLQGSCHRTWNSGQECGPHWDRVTALGLHYNPTLPDGVKKGKQGPRYSFIYMRNMLVKTSHFFKLFLLSCTCSSVNRVVTCDFSLCMATPACRAAVSLHGQPSSQSSRMAGAASCLPVCQLNQVALPCSLVLGSWQVHNLEPRLHLKMCPFLVKLWVGWRFTAEVLPQGKEQMRASRSCCAMDCSIWSAQGTLQCSMAGDTAALLGTAAML